MDPEELVTRYVRAIGLSSAPLLDTLWTPRENQDATIAAMLKLTTDTLASLRAGFREQLADIHCSSRR